MIRRATADDVEEIARLYERSFATLDFRRFYERHGRTAIEFTDGEGNQEKTPDVRCRWTSSG